MKEVRLSFNKDSGLLLKEEFSAFGARQRVEIFYSDYKVSGGIPLAQRLVPRTDGHVNYRSLVEFKRVDRFDEKLFKKP